KKLKPSAQHPRPVRHAPWKPHRPRLHSWQKHQFPFRCRQVTTDASSVPSPPLPSLKQSKKPVRARLIVVPSSAPVTSVHWVPTQSRFVCTKTFWLKPACLLFQHRRNKLLHAHPGRILFV